ncbi:preprotein translocase subunit YajC [Leifsonia sp. A12D58]|uniref:preprotein translocase subunit YajC n=1 Tax=Leifsonia sp. A12D58 TaxID=3397674 RepID=UPI0039DF4F82
MDPLTLIMLAVLALLVFFMFRNSRKRQKDTASLQSKMVAGAKVMTNFGLFGTIVSIDEEENKVALEIAPGTIVEIHRQTIARVVEPVADDEESADAVTSLDSTSSLNEPEFGERNNDVSGDVSGDEPKKGDA